MWTTYMYMQVKYTCTINHRLFGWICVKWLVLYCLRFTPDALQAHKKTWKKIMLHTVCDSHNMGFRKDNLAKWNDGSSDFTGKRNKVGWREEQGQYERAQSANGTHTLYTRSTCIKSISLNVSSWSIHFNEMFSAYRQEQASTREQNAYWACFTYFCSVVLIICRSESDFWGVKTGFPTWVSPSESYQNMFIAK